MVLIYSDYNLLEYMYNSFPTAPYIHEVYILPCLLGPIGLVRITIQLLEWIFSSWSIDGGCIKVLVTVYRNRFMEIFESFPSEWVKIRQIRIHFVWGLHSLRSDVFSHFWHLLYSLVTVHVLSTQISRSPQQCHGFESSRLRITFTDILKWMGGFPDWFHSWMGNHWHGADLV